MSPMIALIYKKMADSSTASPTQQSVDFLKDNAQATDQTNKLILEQIPFTGSSWYYPNSGVDAIIYPDFYNNSDSTDTSSGTGDSTTLQDIYWPSYQLANLYAAYNPSKNFDSPFTVTLGQADPVAGSLSGIDFQTSGLTTALLDIYSRIAYAPSQKQSEEFSSAISTMDQKFEGLADLVQEAYVQLGKSGGSSATLWTEASNQLFGPGNGSVTKSATGAIQSSLGQMAIIIAQNSDTALVAGTQFAAGAPDASSDSQSLQGYISKALTSGQANWSDDFTGVYGTNAIGLGNPLPWNESLYAKYLEIINDPSNTTVKDYMDAVSPQRNKLENAVTYLSSLLSYNDQPDLIFTEKVSNYMKIAPGIPGADTYAPRISATPLSGDSGSSVELEFATKDVTSNTAKANSSSTVTWDASASAGGWFFTSASASNQGSDTKQNGWEKLDDSAKSMTGTFNWDNLTQKTITLGDNWFLQDILNQAWSQPLTTDNPKFGGGFGFESVDDAQDYISTTLYVIDSFVYGKPNPTIKGTTTNTKQYSAESFHSFEQKTSASVGIGWGPFSMNASSTYSTANSQSDSQFKFDSSGTSFTVTNDPLAGLSSVKGAGTPSAMIAASVKPVGTAQSKPVQPTASGKSSNSSTSSTPNAAASSRLMRGKNNNNNVTYLITHHDPDAPSARVYVHNLSSRNNVHYGSTKKDKIYGRSGDDVLAGLDGNDRIDGGRGDDVIYGGAGKTRVIGGKGSDYYVFQKEHVSDGAFAKIKDFTTKDALSFSGYSADDIEVKGRRLFLDGDLAAKFSRTISSSQITELIADAHFSGLM